MAKIISYNLRMQKLWKHQWTTYALSHTAWNQVKWANFLKKNKGHNLLSGDEQYQIHNLSMWHRHLGQYIPSENTDIQWKLKNGKYKHKHILSRKSIKESTGSKYEKPLTY